MIFQILVTLIVAFGMGAGGMALPRPHEKNISQETTVAFDTGSNTEDVIRGTRASGSEFELLEYEKLCKNWEEFTKGPLFLQPIGLIDDKCVWIFTQSSCPDGQWMVYDPVQNITDGYKSRNALCSKSKCPMERNERRYNFFFEYKGKCYLSGASAPGLRKNMEEKIFLIQGEDQPSCRIVAPVVHDMRVEQEKPTSRRMDKNKKKQEEKPLKKDWTDTVDKFFPTKYLRRKLGK